MHTNSYRAPSLEEIVWWGRSAHVTQCKTQEIIRILSDLDAQHNLRLEELQRRPLDEATRYKLMKNLRDAHREAREPYVRQLEELRNR